MKGKAKSKLKFRPTPISRLSRYKVPLKMVGDPEWLFGGSDRNRWANRERIVYDHEMERKSWPMAWEPEIYRMAWDDNLRIDHLIRIEWLQYDDAIKDHKKWLWNEAYNSAERDNAEWDYHRDNYLEDVA